MNVTTRMTYLLLAMFAIVFLPWLGSMIHHGGTFPPDFFDYPMVDFIPKSPFSPVVFTIVAIGFAFTASVYLFPGIYGFKKLPLPPKKEKKQLKFPWWFWFGLLAWGSALILLWTKSTWPLQYLHWSDLPLFWGFVLVVDGFVYKRNNGISLISKIPQEIIGIGVASISGWMIFEYLNFFLDDNWYYPKGHIIPREQFLLYAIVISSGLMPLAFEWYTLFKTYPAFSQRFSSGFKIRLSGKSKNVLLVLGLIGMFASGLFPDQLFFALWLSPPIILGVVLDKIGVWSPLRSIGVGNWSPVLLSGLTYLVEGVFLEGQNYFSATYGPGGVATFTEDPAFWQYNLPFVNAYHLFQMPGLGYLGYLPFGVYCWLWWIVWATLLNVPARFLHEDPLEISNE